MKLFAIMLVAMATIVSCEDMQMLELTPALGSSSNCEVSLWCQDFETAERCDKVSYCTKWIWSEVPLEEAPDNLCDECKAWMAKLLAGNNTDIKIVCGFLSFWKNCSVDIHKIIDGETPAKLCALLELCPQSADFNLAGILTQLMSVTQSEFSDAKCDDCIKVADFIKENNETIKNLFDGLCAKLGVAERELCKLATNTLIKELNSLNSTQLCQKVDLCAKSTPLLGADLCTRGPAYWCASLDNAKECEAFDFCKTKVWV